MKRRRPGLVRALLGAAGIAAVAAALMTLTRDSGPNYAQTVIEAPSEPAVALAPNPWGERERPAVYKSGPVETITAKEHGIKAMPAASAGSNGSYKPRAGRDRIDVRSYAAGAPSRRDAALLLGDVALPPASAPIEIKRAITAANQITNQPYVWGGGHASFRSRGYDCSGAVSYALAGAGLIGRPATSGELMGWGAKGKGRWLTVYANGGHVYAVIAGLRFDTVGLGRGVGPRWHPANAYPKGYVARHIPGL